MTDPRAAALAEALDTLAGDPMWSGNTTDWSEIAAAILAALPPDWCGHIGVEEVIAQAQHDAACRDELARQQAVEIARLRRIEKAARRLVVSHAMAAYGVVGGPAHRPENFREYVSGAAIDELRAALEGASE